MVEARTNAENGLNGLAMLDRYSGRCESESTAPKTRSLMLSERGYIPKTLDSTRSDRAQYLAQIPAYPTPSRRSVSKERANQRGGPGVAFVQHVASRGTNGVLVDAPVHMPTL